VINHVSIDAACFHICRAHRQSMFGVNLCCFVGSHCCSRLPFFFSITCCTPNPQERLHHFTPTGRLSLLLNSVWPWWTRAVAAHRTSMGRLSIHRRFRFCCKPDPRSSTVGTGQRTSFIVQVAKGGRTAGPYVHTAARKQLRKNKACEHLTPQWPDFKISPSPVLSILNDMEGSPILRHRPSLGTRTIHHSNARSDFLKI
jgi:hypothetical protein